MKFKTSSGIKSIVGKDLITDRYIAIFELVKNSYDARATEVIVSFNTSEDTEKGIGNLEDGKIYIVDNGTGMSKSDLENKWLFLAYSEKKEGQSDFEEDGFRELKNRAYVGSKGIGRFSSDCLGGIIKIRTKVANENIEHQLTVNWDKFDISLNKRFEDIAVHYKENQNLSKTDVDSYTIVEISNLRDGWQDDELTKVADKLKRLKNPFLKNDDLDIYSGVDIFKLHEEFTKDSSYLITNNISDILSEKSINITAVIENNNIVISLKDRGKTIYEITKKDNSLLGNLDRINISINYLTTSAKATFTRRMGVAPVNYGNIFIYRNGFHVSPYGEEHFDIFGLNARKTQGYNRYLATRELIGFISIEDSKNYFKEASSRDNGFVENGYLTALTNFYMEYVQRPLERYVRLIKFGEDKDTQKDLNTNNIDISDNEKENFKRYILKTGFRVKQFDENLDFEFNKPEKIIERIKIATDNPSKKLDIQQVKKDTKQLEKQFKEFKKEATESQKTITKKAEQIQQLERQNRNLITSQNRSSKSYSEELHHHFTSLANRLQYVITDLMSIKQNISSGDLPIFMTTIDDVKSTITEMEVFNRLIKETDLDLKSPQKCDWFAIANWYFLRKGRGSYYPNYQVTCIADNQLLNKWQITANYIDVVMLFENFYRNAFEHNANILEIKFTEQQIFISSNSTPIDNGNTQKIFELGFSTKQDGTGIGLHQIKAFLDDINLSIDVKNVDGLVQFVIE